MLDTLEAGIETMRIDEIHERVKAQMGRTVTQKTISNNLTNLLSGKTPVSKRLDTTPMAPIG